jgi:hypothetical protein
VKRKEWILRWAMMFLMVGLVIGLVAFQAKAESVVRVHMIDARSGSPLANQPVRLWPRDTAQQRNNPGYVQEMTDSNGIATFHLKDPISSYLYIHIGMSAPWEECFPDSQNGFVTQELLETGVSKESACWKLPSVVEKFRPSPGDVYIFAVRDTLVQRVKALGH